MAKCVEIQWNVTPFRSDEFLEIWEPHAAAVIDFGARGYSLLRSLEDTLIVTQLAYFETKDEWEAYWNSDRLIAARRAVSGMHQVPVVYAWQEIVTEGAVAEV